MDCSILTCLIMKSTLGCCISLILCILKSSCALVCGILNFCTSCFEIEIGLLYFFIEDWIGGLFFCAFCLEIVIGLLGFFIGDWIGSLFFCAFGGEMEAISFVIVE